MEKKSFLQNLRSRNWFPFTVLILWLASALLASPKFAVGLAAWTTPVFFLYFFRITTIRRKWLWFIPIVIIQYVLGAMDVAPFPLPVLLVLGLISSLKWLLIGQADRWVTLKSGHFLLTLFFPSLCVLNEYLEAVTGGGAWGSLANSQIHFPFLTQLASVTGIWGISFVIYWMASVFIWVLERKKSGRSHSMGIRIAAGVLLLVLTFGGIRYYSGSHTKTIKVAGLSVPLYSFLESLYFDFSGKKATIDPKISVASPRLQEINRAQIPFIETADTVRFRTGYAALRQVQDSLFALSCEAAEKGAKLITWSEGNCMAFRFQDSDLLARGKQLAGRYKVYLLMAMGVLDTGKLEPGKKFLENKAVLIGPDGNVLNVFHKNNPVPYAEASKPGDGKIPVISTGLGRISTSICYDADFPVQMRQLSANRSEVLLLPSGDWHAISPYHTHMAIYRGIENGCSVIRQVSGGWSAATDYRGRVFASMDFYRPGKKLWIAEVPVGFRSTIYSQIGDLLVYLSMIVSLTTLVWAFCYRGIKRNNARKAASD